MVNLEDILELKKIGEEKKRLKECETRLSTPLLFDYTLIPQIYKWFTDIEQERDCPSRSLSTQNRKKFIMIIVFLYSPRCFIGVKMKRGLRNELAKLMPYKNACFLSQMFENIFDQYRYYKTVRSEISVLYDKIRIKLQESGNI
jgi:hypothetical protein